ncbi:MAG: Thioesterase superfamily protein [Syntrophorhabdaceae bacterium PtaU1.Bin034]|nr:MAG: Thioesterase superfamily protein [Syntrophorhabdaceae bacterium PtaU1.Bin034]
MTVLYPPLNQMLSDLSPVLAFQTPDKATLRAPVCPVVGTDRGTMLLGVMATLMDVLGGGLALTTFNPDWAATTHLSVHSTGRALSGYIDAQGELKKTGRNTVLVKVDIRHRPNEHGGPARVATAIVSFTRFSPRERSRLFRIGPMAGKMPYSNPDRSNLAQPFYDKVGLKILNEAEAVVQVEISDYVRNSFNALHGGVAALLADLAGQTAARHATGKPFVTTDLAIHFLSLGQVGPFRTKTTMLRKTDETVLSLVEILDTGAGDRLLSIATNLASLDDLG